MSSSKKRVLVCGATGFIGRNVVERLSSRGDLEVTAVFNQTKNFDHPSIRWIQADLTKSEDVARALEGIDTVIQAAATTSGAKDIVSRPHIHVTNNAVMNALLFRGAHDQRVPHVVFLSCSVMYPTGLGRAANESDFTGEIFPNYFGVGWTKVYTEKMAEFFSQQKNTRYTVIRHSNTYGPHDKFDLERSHVFGATVNKVMNAGDGKVAVWGDGSEERDLLYVDDLVDYIEKAIEIQNTAFELHNVGSGRAISIAELVKKIILHSGKNLEIVFDRSKPTIKTSLYLDNSKAEARFAWKPKTTLNEGILKTLEWYRSHL
jgi:GDP-L-fucose synthase